MTEAEEKSKTPKGNKHRVVKSLDEVEDDFIESDRCRLCHKNKATTWLESREKYLGFLRVFMQVCEPCKDNYDPNHKQEIREIPTEIQRDWNKRVGELKKQRINKLKSIDRKWREANK